MMKNNVDWPTERHRNLGEHIFNICSTNRIGLLLKGSIAKGTARPYSDIDISLYGNISKDIIGKILYGFEKPLMICASEKPPGLLIVAYRKGLALDLGIKGVQRIDEKGESILLISPSLPAYGISDSTEEYLKEIARDDRYSKIAKLIYKGLLKYLNGKRDEAREFIKEIIEFTGMQINDRRKLVEAFQAIMMAFIRKDDVMWEEFHWLMEEISREWERNEKSARIKIMRTQ
jgi:hypothetical protein